jgi:hypothetical protein
MVVDLDSLRDAYEWVSADEVQNEAFVSRSTGEICWRSPELEPEQQCPKDIELHGGEYLRIPSRHDLRLGNVLAFDFIDLHAPEQRETVIGFFRRRGAYARFKEFLLRRQLLDLWRQYQEERTVQTLRKWAEDNGLLPPAGEI